MIGAVGCSSGSSGIDVNSPMLQRLNRVDVERAIELTDDTAYAGDDRLVEVQRFTEVAMICRALFDAGNSEDVEAFSTVTVPVAEKQDSTNTSMATEFLNGWKDRFADDPSTALADLANPSECGTVSSTGTEGGSTIAEVVGAMPSTSNP